VRLKAGCPDDWPTKKGRILWGGFGWGGVKELAATYSRGVYKTTTIGKTVFDGRVRNGNGSDHSFMATKMKCRVQSSECRMKTAF
jgi:hypothetical protein